MEIPRTDIKRFLNQKEQCLLGLDLSRKGSVDAPILELVNFINSQPDCFTTSSCSGRIILVDNIDDECEIQKQGCRWLYVRHEEACFNSVKEGLQTRQGAAVFKFEPMVMHIQVRTLQLAQRLHATAVASGFRNSGITIGGKGKIIVAIRSTHSLEVPLSYRKELLVTDDYIKHLILCANKKMQENTALISRFFDNFKAMVTQPSDKVSKKKSNKRELQQNRDVRNSSENSESTSSKDRATDKELSEDDSSSRDGSAIEDCFDSLLFEET